MSSRPCFLINSSPLSFCFLKIVCKSTTLTFSTGIFKVLVKSCLKSAITQPSAFVIPGRAGTNTFGIPRPLTILDDYKWLKGNKVKIILKEPFMGKKSHIGFLRGVDEKNLIILKTDDFEMNIDFSEIDKANVDINWAIENKQIN